VAQIRQAAVVVKHSIGNGEVDSSILSGSTSFFNKINTYRAALSPLRAQFGTRTQNEA
jgi:hypothetical protein